MPDRKARERLADWRAAERAEKDTGEGSNERRRAHATSRRARWAFEDAARLAGADHGAASEPFERTLRRATTRLAEASEGAAEVAGDRAGGTARHDTPEQREKRLRDEAEIARELNE